MAWHYPLALEVLENTDHHGQHHGQRGASTLEKFHGIEFNH
jgi:hypothetical protein